MHTREIPILDLKNTGNDEAVRIFGEGLKEFGFVTVVNHGVDAALLHRAYDVAARVFALPQETKRRYETLENGRYTGYASFGVEHAKDDPRPDLKEFWHVRRNVPEHQRQYPAEIGEFEETFIGLFDSLDGLSLRLLCLLGTYLGKPEGHFESMVWSGATLLRLLHYPELKGQEDGMRAAPHEDINFITLLVSATAAGLEVRTRDGRWLAVNNPPDAIIVNSGDMLSMHTFGAIPSTTHRVVNGDGRQRYSIPFFVHPRSEVPLVTAGDFLTHRLEEIGLK